MARKIKHSREGLKCFWSCNLKNKRQVNWFFFVFFWTKKWIKKAKFSKNNFGQLQNTYRYFSLCTELTCALKTFKPFFRRPNYYDIIRSINVSRKEMLEWYDFVLSRYAMFGIKRRDQVWNGDETAVSSMDNVPYVDSSKATSVRIIGLMKFWITRLAF
jgi:hypothetical protein